MVRSVAGDLPEQVKNNQYVNLAAGNGGQKMSQYSWFTVYRKSFIIAHFISSSTKFYLLLSSLLNRDLYKHQILVISSP